MIGYKLLKMKDGNLYPLYVDTKTRIPIGVWVDAKEGERLPNGKVKSRLGPLQFRPGWHLSEIPLAVHIGIKENGVIRFMHDDEVWCECEYSDEINYQPVVEKNGRGYRAMMTSIPVRGYYRFKTSPQMLGKWIIAGSMKINRILSDEEAAKIVRSAGYEPLPRSPNYTS
ncbi:MAG TPA: hypothetical protein DGX96_03960 [Lachnospiraceae bacterium]|jgi:hypothetical protein|nr:hypothetical protein [Lachnospiraceae bacterium]